MDTLKLLQGPAFKVEAGGVTGVIEGEGHWFIVSVHDSRGGGEIELEDEDVKSALTKLVLEERAKKWERWYLQELRKRLADEK